MLSSRHLLRITQRELIDPLLKLQDYLGVESAEGVWLDYIGTRLGFPRPAVQDDDTNYFGFHVPGAADSEQNLTFGEGPMATDELHLHQLVPRWR